MSTLLKFKIHGYTTEDDSSEQTEILEVIEGSLADRAAALATEKKWLDYWAEEIK